MQADPVSSATARERMLRSAITLISRHGPDKLTHRMVADDAGVSPGTATYHFSTLDDLIEQAFLLYIEDYKCAMDAALEARPLTTLGDIAAFLAMLTSLDPEDAELAQFEYSMILHAQRHGNLREAVESWANALEQRVATALEKLGQARAWPLANMAIQICRGIEIEVLSRHQRRNEAKLRARLLAVFRGD